MNRSQVTFNARSTILPMDLAIGAVELMR